MYLFTFIFLAAFTAYGQSGIDGKGFSYQGYARDNAGAALGNESVTVKFSVTVSGSSTVVFSEEHTLTTDPFGVFHTVIGSVNTTDYNALAFGQNNYKMKIEVKTPSTNYVEIGNAELLAVPYAKAAGNGVLTGTVSAFMGHPDKVSEGYLICDGRQVSRTEYAALFSVLGTTYGTGDGSSTFNLPDLRGQFLRGWHGGDGSKDLDKNDRVGGVSGSGGVGSLQAENIIAHTHTGSTNITGDHNHKDPASPDHNQEAGFAFSDGGATADGTDGTGGETNLFRRINMTNNGAHSHSFTTDQHGGNENRPKNIAVLYIIKY